jgi:ubiquinone/menaquinone biosynthesis C-methylase UbiE
MAYVLGHSQPELQRLVEQSRYIGEHTDELFSRAGLAPGMRVLDAGCGSGDVSFLAAALVGPSGSVLGVDRSADALGLARDRAAAARLENVRFTQADVTELGLDERFDAVVGRFVLAYLDDPVGAVRRIVRHLRPGGVVVFQESVLTPMCSAEQLPLARTASGWICELFARAGLRADMGWRLPQVFREAGLPRPEVVARTAVGSGPDSGAYALLAETIRSLLPRIEALGVASAEDVGIDSLADRLRDETVSAGALIVLPTLVGAWVNP